MKVIPLAADSLGVRSMATYVEADGVGILIDPGAFLAPARFNLPPAATEWEALSRARDRITAHAGRAGVVFISHYHEEHFRPDATLYAGRTVLAKDPRRMVGGRQAARAAELWRSVTPVARLESADATTRRVGSLDLKVSPSLPHGDEGNGLGSVVVLTVAETDGRDRFVFGSDVQGPFSAVVTGYLIQEQPTLLYLSGPPSYLEREIGTAAIDRAIDNLLRVIAATGCRVIMDHYALRDPRFVDRFARLWDTGMVVTAAKYLGVPAMPLESRRRQEWAAVRKPEARVARPRAIISRAPRTLAKGGHGT